MRATLSQVFETARNDADVNGFAEPDQEFWSMPIERIVREEPTSPVIDCCELLKGYTAREPLGDVARRGLKNERDVNIPESESGTRYFPIR